ncbi:DUF7534 family protein [Halobaculum sp. D14]|uniref:DUF7534 family protein n=1 Tax=unclassified Halobaculum TaxID=2640896 RepID=UPI003EB7093C
MALHLAAVLLFAATALLVAASAASFGYWVYLDADARGTDAAAVLGAATVFVSFVGVWYWLRRSAYGDRDSPPSRTQRAAGSVAVASFCAVVLAAVVAPPDPVTQGVWAAGSLAVTAPAAYLLVYRRGWRALTARVS